MKVQFLGTGDSFGHGGRLQACILIETEQTKCLLDCGTTVLNAMQQFHRDPNEIDGIFISHLHGDHFCGLPFFLLDAQLHSRRQRPLLLAGPSGFKKRLTEAMELMFPGSSKTVQKFDLQIIEIPSEGMEWNGIRVLPFEMVHASGDPALALQVTHGKKTLAYSGDTEWNERIPLLAQKTDLLIAEAYFYDKQIKFHMSFKTWHEKMALLQTKQIIFTHMGPEMLSHISEIPAPYLCAYDGMEFMI